MYIIQVTLKNIGTRYVVDRGQEFDNAWITRYEHRAKTWKTRAGAQRWLNAHPEVDGIIIEV